MGLRRGALWRISVIGDLSRHDTASYAGKEWNFAPTKDLNPAPANIWQTVKNMPMTDPNAILAAKQEQLARKLSRPRPQVKANLAQHIGKLS